MKSGYPQIAPYAIAGQQTRGTHMKKTSSKIRPEANRGKISGRSTQMKFRTSASLHQRIKLAADKNKVNMADIIIDAVEEHLEKLKKSTPLKLGTPNLDPVLESIFLQQAARADLINKNIKIKYQLQQLNRLAEQFKDDRISAGYPPTPVTHGRSHEDIKTDNPDRIDFRKVVNGTVSDGAQHVLIIEENFGKQHSTAELEWAKLADEIYITAMTADDIILRAIPPNFR